MTACEFAARLRRMVVLGISGCPKRVHTMCRDVHLGLRLDYLVYTEGPKLSLDWPARHRARRTLPPPMLGLQGREMICTLPRSDSHGGIPVSR